MAFGSKIEELRKIQNLTQKELANLIGVTTGTIAEWEANDTVPNFAELARLSKALAVSSDVLLEFASECTVAPTPEKTTNSTSEATSSQDERKEEIAPQKGKKLRLLMGVAVLAVGIIVAFLFLFRPALKPFSEDTAAIQKADASVVKIYCYNYDGELEATGSGFVAFDGKTVITNYHVMTSAYTCKVSTNQDISYEVSGIRCYSEDQDIAILKLTEDTELSPLPLGNSSDILKGETVVAIGSPLGIKNTVSTGVLSGRIMEGNMDVLQFTAPISSGSSGGALFDDGGNVIGITYASYIDGQNLNLAIPIELAVKLYEKRGTTTRLSSVYTKEHPHVTYLSEYKNVPKVTLADLKQKPLAYDGKIVRLSVYVSSWIKDTEHWWGIDKWFLSEKNDISLDFDFDLNRRPGRAGFSYQSSPVIECDTNLSRSKYVDNAVRPGDNIEIIAYFDFHQKGDPLIPDDPEANLFWTYDIAELESIVIWKP